jgi:Trypsin-co-occurring domain 1
VPTEPTNLRLIPVNLGKGVTVNVEATSLPSPAGSRPKNVSFRPGELHFDTISAVIKQLSILTLEAVKQAKPTKASVEFGVDVGIESGQLTALLVKGEAKGNFKISLEWSSKPE